LFYQLLFPVGVSHGRSRVPSHSRDHAPNCTLHCSTENPRPRNRPPLTTRLAIRGLTNGARANQPGSTGRAGKIVLSAGRNRPSTATELALTAGSSPVAAPFPNRSDRYPTERMSFEPAKRHYRPNRLGRPSKEGLFFPWCVNRLSATISRLSGARRPWKTPRVNNFI